MNRNEIMWILHCCLFALDDVSKERLMENGATDNEAEIGIKICDYLKNKKIVVEINNGKQY